MRRHAQRFALRSYTGDEDFALADAVFDCIGDKGSLYCCLAALLRDGIS